MKAAMPYSPLELADAFIRTGELNDALDALNAHLNAHPDDNMARRLRVSVLRRMESTEHYRSALEDLDHLTNPTADDAVERSILLQSLDDWPGANQAMQRAHTLKPEDDRITERYLMTLERSGSPEKARELLQNLPKTWRWLQIAGDLAYRMKDRESAVKCYEAALVHLDAQMDTTANAIAANLKAVLILKRDAVTADA
jgi:tetratricopeptide (TPR) repeat protein